MKKILIVLLAAVMIMTLFAEERTDTAFPTDTVEPSPEGEATPKGIPDASDHTVDHVVRYTTPDGKLLKEETIPATYHLWKY